jgi:hypothetical protein
VARCAHLLRQQGKPIALETLELKAELMREYADLLPARTRDAARRVRGAQAVIVEHDPERALQALPALVKEPGERERLLVLLERLMADRRVYTRATPTQRAMLARIRRVLEPAAKPAAKARKPAAKVRKPAARAGKPAAKAKRPQKKGRSAR